MVLAWHFTGETLRDGTPVPKPNEKLTITGKVVLCKNGYHGSEKLFDALRHAPYVTYVHRVDITGDLAYDYYYNDKLVGSERTILWTTPAKDILYSKSKLIVEYLTHNKEKLINHPITGNTRYYDIDTLFYNNDYYSIVGLFYLYVSVISRPENSKYKYMQFKTGNILSRNLTYQLNSSFDKEYAGNYKLNKQIMETELEELFYNNRCNKDKNR